MGNEVVPMHGARFRHTVLNFKIIPIVLEMSLLYKINGPLAYYYALVEALFQLEAESRY
jgi:hypothetical protein